MGRTAGWPYLVARAATWTVTGTRCLTAAGLRSAAVRAGRAVPGRTPAEILTAGLVRLGPSFVKGGQMLSSRADLLPPSWCAPLGRLTDRMDPMPFPAARRALAAAYPPGRDWPFAALDRTAVASGSIACVYRARLHDGREVAVKVRRPGIGRRMHADFRLLSLGADLAQRLPGLRGTPMRRMVEQVAPAVLNQLDLRREAWMLDRLRRNLDGLVRVPAPVPPACGDGVLVMEFLDGLERFDPGAFEPAQRRTIVRNVLQAIYRMLFADGLVHCDLHPGNLYLRRSGEVVIVDAGFVVELTPRVRKQFAQFFLHMVLGNGDACADVVLASAAPIPAHSDLDGFRRGIRDLIASTHRRRAGQFRLASFANRLFTLQRTHGITAAPEFVFPLLSLLTLEGMVLGLDVDVDFQREAVPTLLKALQIKESAEEAR
ncbi:ABC1 kinase family protein [Nucisporomicrobium flavum]|uniref:ABC1 kinase family protein n=1 Tax=Nucisporomicrobium flavum TaxID=2785915 RepID=UPI0018F47DA8|nr:AarF/UbiB family protein [Nucisporomicrobium flavum]